MVHTFLIAAITFFLALEMPAEPPAHKTTADIPRAGDFDFLLGVWDLEITSSLPGIPPNLKGRWTATAVADSLVIADEYRVFDDKGATAYLGMTYRAFNPASKAWDIRYIEAMNGKWYEAKGWRDGATMRVEQRGSAQSADVLLRFQYYQIAADHFRWRSEQSDDGGKTWAPYGLTIEATRRNAERQLALAKSKVMSADYRADLAELERLRQEVLSLADDAALGYLARYWAGFASWRIAINGANDAMSPKELKANLEKAATDFDASVRLKDDFADSYSAGAGVHGWLIGLNGDNAAAMREHIARATRMLARAKALEPDNPRVLWVEGGALLSTPREHGGNPERAIEVYRRAIETADAKGWSESSLPDWGKPEALMALAYAHLHQSPPDIASAEEEARAALRLQPQWSYVRDVLLPQIKAAAASREELTAMSTSNPTGKDPLRDFSFVIGRWSVDGRTYRDEYGKSGERSTGRTEASWGAGQAWIETRFDASLPTGQPYTVRIVIAARPGGVGLSAFAVNTMSRSGILYEGEVIGPGNVRFLAQAGAKWQRVIYRRQDDGRVDFLVEEANWPNGPWTPHSHAVWTAEPPDQSERP